MLLFNVTVIVEEASAADWLSWMKEVHIPQLMETESFVSHRLLKIVDSPNEGVSYCVQFIAESEEKHQSFLALHEKQFIADIYAKYPNKLVVFSTLMEFVA
ncbi:DUF4286 family protein [Pedobacter xixiisoli]|uniref:DUF4286 domain-containing protein n=1 Tax=Pedobacter xixiisoli TaxID=1476464 RepID=A0A286AEX6_9SPHI|nr:DUF4286 family protein [Pedobacter xixiisoli]SOD20464.1 protein of unknown function [Pedobacter xixiisoli]